MRRAFAEGLCLHPDSVLIDDRPVAPILARQRLRRVRAKLGRLAPGKLDQVETIIDRILEAEARDG